VSDTVAGRRLGGSPGRWSGLPTRQGARQILDLVAEGDHPILLEGLLVRLGVQAIDDVSQLFAALIG
jgi:hypothetical protein